MKQKIKYLVLFIFLSLFTFCEQDYENEQKNIDLTAELQDFHPVVNSIKFMKDDKRSYCTYFLVMTRQISKERKYIGSKYAEFVFPCEEPNYKLVGKRVRLVFEEVNEDAVK